MIEEKALQFSEKSKSPIGLLIGREILEFRPDILTTIELELPNGLSNEEYQSAWAYLSALESQKANGARQFLGNGVSDRLSLPSGNLEILGFIFRVKDTSKEAQDIQRLLSKYINRLGEKLERKSSSVYCLYIDKGSAFTGFVWDSVKRTAQSFEAKSTRLFAKYFPVWIQWSYSIVLRSSFFKKKLKSKVKKTLRHWNPGWCGCWAE